MIEIAITIIVWCVAIICLLGTLAVIGGVIGAGIDALKGDNG